MLFVKLACAFTLLGSAVTFRTSAPVHDRPPLSNAAAQLACSLNGKLSFGTSGKTCICSPGWTGIDCGALDLAESYTIGAGMTLGKHWTWGGAVLPDHSDGYHAFLRYGPQGKPETPCANSPDQGVNGTTKSPSGIVHLSAPSLFGPYTNAVPIVAPNKSRRVSSVTAAALPPDTFSRTSQINASHVLVWEDQGVNFVRDPVHLASINQWPTTPSRLHINISGAGSVANPSFMLANGTYLLCGRLGGRIPGSGGWNVTLERLVLLQGGKYINATFHRRLAIFNDTDAPVAGEDPFCYKDDSGFHMLFHWFNCDDLYSGVGRHAYSADGRLWFLSATAAYNTSVRMPASVSGARDTTSLTRRERPFLVLDWSSPEARPMALVTSAQRDFYWWDGPPHCGRHRSTTNSSCDASTIITRVLS